VHLLRPKGRPARPLLPYRGSGARGPLFLPDMRIRMGGLEHRSSMTGYRPSSLEIPLVLIGILAATIALGLLLTRRRRPWASKAAWLLAVAAVGTAERLTAREPGGLRMVALCAALFFGMKAIVGVAEVARGTAPLPPVRWL